MDQPAEVTELQPAEHQAPYGDVALGVECAWPGSGFNLLPDEPSES